MIKDLLRAAVVAVATAACFFALLVAAALWLPQDQQAVRRNVVGAVLDGMFTARFFYGPFGGPIWPRHTLDCAAGASLIAPPAGRLLDAMSNRIPAVNRAWDDPRVPPTLDCQAFARTIPELGPGYGDAQYISFDRYILGVRVFARTLLSVMTLDTAGHVMRAVAFLLLGALAFVGLWKLRAAPPGQRERPAAYLVITACLAFLYGVHYFDATLFFAPPDYTHFAFILISLMVPLAAMRPAGLALYAASYGSLIAIFETLTGGIPFALAMLPLLLAIGFNGERRDYLFRLLVLWGSFTVAVVTCFVIKKIFTAAFVESQDSFFAMLLYRMYGEVPADTGTELTLRYILSAYRRWSLLIALGSANLGTALLLGSLGLFLVQGWRMRRSLWTGNGPVLVACWLGIGALIAWVCAFLNHTAVHPYYMARVLVVPLSGAAVLLTLELMRRRAAPRAA